jgi:dipeptidyl aminopeptidase/acylaminoacyl peptidase
MRSPDRPSPSTVHVRPVHEAGCIGARFGIVAGIVSIAVFAGCDPSKSPSPKASDPEPPQPAPATDTAPPPAEPLAKAQPEPAEPQPVADPEPPHPFSVADLMAIDRISDHQVSPDGSTVVFVRRRTNLEDDRGDADIWRVPTQGGQPKVLVDHPANDSDPRFSPDGQTLYFISSRNGSAQVWKVPLAGGSPTQVTFAPVPVANLRISPDGEHLAFSAESFPSCEDLACTQKKLDEHEATKPSGKLYERMFVRHWDTWKDGRRSHIFVAPVADAKDAVDVMKGMDADAPSKPFGGADEFTFSPDSSQIVFAARDAAAQEPWSTNFDLFAVKLDGNERTNLTQANLAWDTRPVFSPDGTSLAWTAMSRPGYEADRFGIKLMAWPPGEVREIAPKWDRSASSLAFAADGRSLLVTAQHLGQKGLFSISLETGEVTELAATGTITDPALAGEAIVLARHDLLHPTELYSMPTGGGEPTPITSINADVLKLAQRGEAEQFSFRGAAGHTVYGYIVKPIDFDAAKKYPIAFLIHGGPQGSFGNMFHHRWNAQTFAGAGYAVVMIDFHGSTGYGQAFTDSIRKDWGGKPLVDLKKGLDFAVKSYPWLDRQRACALGASYGGYMINWIAGKWPDGFRCLVNHDGVFDQRMMYYSTEELWFPEWEHGGPHYAHAQAYEKFNPVRFVDRWKTPMLVIHGGLDYRIPPSQGLAAFTALQRREIPSQLLFFPDENHWVLRPSNSIQWHETVLAWIGRHTAAPEPVEPTRAGETDDPAESGAPGDATAPSGRPAGD